MPSKRGSSHGLFFRDVVRKTASGAWAAATQGAGVVAAFSVSTEIYLADFGNVFYIEHWLFVLDTLRVANRPPTPFSKTIDFLDRSTISGWSGATISGRCWGFHPDIVDRSIYFFIDIHRYTVMRVVFVGQFGCLSMAHRPPKNGANCLRHPRAPKTSKRQP